MSSSLYEIQEILGKGRGLIARSDIPAGTRILFEKPLLMIPDNMPNAELEKRLARDLKALNKEQQRQYLSLHNNYGGKYIFGGIFKTNSVPCGSDSSTIAVFPTISLINHSCLPNSHYTWNDSLEMETVHVTRTINAGEEITICYTNSGSTRVRQAYLKKHFGFDCSCEVCSLSAINRIASDARRERVTQIQDVFSTCDRAKSKPREALLDLRTILELSSEEFQGAAKVIEADTYCYAVQLNIWQSDEARASVFAERAYNALLICVGEDSEDAHEMKRMMDDPASHTEFGFISNQWKPTKDAIPTGLNEEEFEKWLWRLK